MSMSYSHILSEAEELDEGERYSLAYNLILSLVGDPDPMYPGGTMDSLDNLLLQLHFNRWMNTTDQIDNDTAQQLDEYYSDHANESPLNLVKMFNLPYKKPAFLDELPDAPHN